MNIQILPTFVRLSLQEVTKPCSVHFSQSLCSPNQQDEYLNTSMKSFEGLQWSLLLFCVLSPEVVSQRTVYYGLSRLCGSSQTCRSSPASWESPGRLVEDSDQQQKPNFSAQPARWPDASCSRLFSVSLPDLFAVYQPEKGVIIARHHFLLV